MNFLAHAHLSFNDNEVTLGNFIADRVKGSSYNKFPHKIKFGILLHRKIDFFTDTHPVNDVTKKILKEQYGRYAGIAMDVLYDHFLSYNWHIYSELNRKKFVQDFYSLLANNYSMMPNAAVSMSKYMIEQDWLGNYDTLMGLDIIYKRMAGRMGEGSNLGNGIMLITNKYEELNNLFNVFFPELIEYSKKELDELLCN